MTNTEFKDFLEHAYAELETKQEKFIEESNVTGYAEYWIDVERGVLDFLNGDTDKISFEIVCVGSWSHLNENWMWAWANESLPEEIRWNSARLKELYEQTGIKVFMDNGFDCNEMGAVELTAMAVQHLGAIGMYRIPGESSHLYTAVMRKVGQ